MKIDRRCFLSFALGGAAGTALSPLPWKLVDDLSIWTQNWPWTPVPPDGEVSTAHSTCTLCPGGCGITVRKVGERAVKIEGRDGHPVNDGSICLLGLSGLQLLYGPWRVKSPLRRLGERGAGEWEEISWDAAFAELVGELRSLRGAGRSHEVACLVGSAGGTVPHLFARFLDVYGSPNLLRPATLEDSLSHAARLTHGVGAAGYVGFDLENADFVLSLGCGLVEGWGSPVRTIRARSAWSASGAKLVQVEPRLSLTAAKADRWVPCDAGSEGALALGLCHVIVAEELYDKGFVQNRTSGFAEWRENVLAKYEPVRVARLTGIEESAIVALARGFATAARPVALCGRGEGRTPCDVREALATHMLNALVGGLQRDGGVWVRPDASALPWPEIAQDEVAAAAASMPRADGTVVAGGTHGPPVGSALHRVFRDGKPAGGYDLEMLLVYGVNPWHGLADNAVAHQALRRIPYLVSFSPYFDETTMHADLVLPSPTYLESLGDVPVCAGLRDPLLGLAHPVVKPQHDTKPVGDVILAIARALGGTAAAAFPWSDYGSCVEETCGGQWQKMRRTGYLAAPAISTASGDPEFTTRTRKFEFMNEGIAALPELTVPPAEGNAKSFPLLLVPIDSLRIANGFVGDPPFVVKTVENTVLRGHDLLVEVNPRTADEHGLREGELADLATPRGRVRVRVHLYEGLRPGLVAIPRGFGHTGFDEFLAGKGVNYNVLIGPVEDPASGFDVAWGIRAKLEKV
jgi:anaerobic selenocysteine-containing dehydrogenase